MNLDHIEPGDTVTITIPEENREWGYNPCPDGTVAHVVEYTEIAHGRIGTRARHPGIYHNTSWVVLKMPSGKLHTELASRLTLVDAVERERRKKEFEEFRDANKLTWYDTLMEATFKRELPETPAWEGDRIRITEPGHPREGQEYVICGIDYDRLDDKRNDGSKWPAYRFSDSLSGGWHMSASEDDFELVERGQVWKYLHGEPVEFEDIRDEANFHRLLDKYEEVRNPANNLYKWTLEELLDAVQSGAVDGIANSPLPFAIPKEGDLPRLRATRFHDRDLGERVRQATLKGFGRA